MAIRTHASQSIHDFGTSDHCDTAVPRKTGKPDGEPLKTLPPDGSFADRLHEDRRWGEIAEAFAPLGVTALQRTEGLPSTLPQRTLFDLKCWIYSLEGHVGRLPQLLDRVLLLEIEIARDQELATPAGRFRTCVEFTPFVGDRAPARSVFMLSRVAALAAARVQERLQSVVDEHAGELRAAGLEGINLVAWIDHATLCAIPRSL